MRCLLSVVCVAVLAAPSAGYAAMPTACPSGSFDESGFCIVMDAPMPAPYRGGPGGAPVQDIVMRGGGSGPASTPYTFDPAPDATSNIVMTGGGTGPTASEFQF